MVEEEAGWSRDFSTILDEEGGGWLLILLKPKPSQKGGFPQLSTTFLLTLLPLVGLAELALAICVNR